MISLQLEIAQILRTKLQVLRTSGSKDTIRKLIDIYERAVAEVESLKQDLDAVPEAAAVILGAGVAKLPSELIGTIFEHVSDGNGHKALNLSHVDRRWRSISTTTPLVWNILEVDWKTKLGWIAFIIQRSGKCLVVDISLNNVRGDEDPSHYRALCRALTPHSQRWRKFTGFRYVLWEGAHRTEHIDATNLSILGISGKIEDCKLDFSHFPSLNRLTFSRDVSTEYVDAKCATLFGVVTEIKCVPSSDMEFLSRFSILERLEFRGCDSAPRRSYAPFVLPCLKEVYSYAGTLDAFLSNVTAPSLRKLNIKIPFGEGGLNSCRIPTSRFPSLVDIRYKLMSPGYIHWDRETIEGMKGVETMWIEGAERLDETLAVLKDEDALPNLSCLKIANCEDFTLQLLKDVTEAGRIKTTRLRNCRGLAAELLGSRFSVLDKGDISAEESVDIEFEYYKHGAKVTIHGRVKL